MTLDEMKATIDALFEDYEGGFAAWCWNARPETLDALYSGDLLDLADDVRYSVQQTDDARIRNLGKSEMRDAAIDWLDEHTDELILEIGESYDDMLDEDAGLKYEDRIDRLSEIFFDDCHIERVGQYFVFTDSQYKWIGRCGDLTDDVLDNIEATSSRDADELLCANAEPVDWAEGMTPLAAVSAQVGHVIRPI